MKMENHTERKEKLLDLISNNLPASEAQALQAHLQDCQQCAQEKKAIEQIWDALSSVDEVDVPATLREETLGQIYAESDKKGWWVASVKRFIPLSLRHTLAATILGIAMILLYGFILTQRVNLEYLTAMQLLTAIVVWSGLFISAFSLLFAGYNVNKINFRFAATVGIVATGVTMVGALFCPEETFFQIWMTSKIGISIEKMIGLAGSHLFLGILYGFLPAIFSATVLGFKCQENIARNGLTAAFSFVVLMLPAAYIQCEYLSLWAIMIGFSVGSLSGAIGGIFTGLGISHLGLRWSSA